MNRNGATYQLNTVALKLGNETIRLSKPENNGFLIKTITVLLHCSFLFRTGSIVYGAI